MHIVEIANQDLGNSIKKIFRVFLCSPDLEKFDIGSVKFCIQPKLGPVIINFLELNYCCLMATQNHFRINLICR